VVVLDNLILPAQPQAGVRPPIDCVIQIATRRERRVSHRYPLRTVRKRESRPQLGLKFSGLDENVRIRPRAGVQDFSKLSERAGEQD